MGIPRKGSKRVEVDGKPYRYLVKETHVPGHKDQKELSITVQEDVAKPGRVLQWRFSFGCAVTSEDIRSAVRIALKAGWKPSERGGPFSLGTTTAFRCGRDHGQVSDLPIPRRA